MRLICVPNLRPRRYASRERTTQHDIVYAPRRATVLHNVVSANPAQVRYGPVDDTWKPRILLSAAEILAEYFRDPRRRPEDHSAEVSRGRLYDMTMQRCTGALYE